MIFKVYVCGCQENWSQTELFNSVLMFYNIIYTLFIFGDFYNTNVYKTDLKEIKNGKDNYCLL